MILALSSINIIYLVERMHCRPPRKIKRYVTDPDQCGVQHKCKYNNLTLQELKIQLTPLQTLNQINVPSVPNNRINIQKSPTHFLALQPKFHLRRNPLKRLNDINTQAQSSNNGYEISKSNNGPQIFKNNNPLFVVNTLIDILKEEKTARNDVSYQKKVIKDKKQNQSNQFTDFEGKSVKIHRGPRLVEGELSRLTQQSNFSRRKIYSQQKSRQKIQGQVQLLTFYKPKKLGTLINNQFLV